MSGILNSAIREFSSVNSEKKLLFSKKFGPKKVRVYTIKINPGMIHEP
jgi:hypothetical protein